MVCEYGCNQEAKFQLKNGKWCCSITHHQCSEIKRKNSKGLKKSYQKDNKPRGYCGNKNLQRKSIESRIKNLKEKPFEEWGRKLQNELILKEQNYKCIECSIEKIWNNKPLVFELDHIDGNHYNNKKENLRLLCPNCHSQTHSWRGRGTNKGKVLVSDNDLLKAIKGHKNIRQALKSLNLAGGGNYLRVKKLINSLDGGIGRHSGRLNE